MAEPFDKAKLEAIIDASDEALGGKSKELKAALQSESMDKVLRNLKPGDAQKLQNVLSDKAALDKLLSTPQAQMLLKKFLEGNKK